MNSTKRNRWIIFALATGLAGCDSDHPTAPSAPPPTAQPQPTGITVAGIVYDAAWRTLGGARIEVVTGQHSGLAATADARGEYRITGAFDETTRFRATKDGHAAAEFPLPERCERCNPNWWLHFYLEALAPHANLEGNYTITLVANSACTGLPDDVRTRTYDAAVTRVADSTNSRFDVLVKGSRTVQHFDRFTIGAAGDYLAADVGDWGHGAAGLVEQIASNTYLSVAGGFTGSASAATISGTFYGVVERCELKTEWGLTSNCVQGKPVAHEQCGPMVHELTFTRR